MSDLDLALTTLLVGSVIGLYFRVWVLILAGLLVFIAAFVLAQAGIESTTLKVFRSVEILVIFEIGYMLGAGIAVSRGQFRSDLRGNLNKQAPHWSEKPPKTPG